MKTANNFKDVIKPIRYFDKLFSGETTNMANAGDIAIVTKLIEAQLNGTDKGSEDYVHELFRAFVQGKKRLWIDYDWIIKNSMFEGLREIMFHKLEKTVKEKLEKRKATDYTNILQPRFVQAFKQLEIIQLLVSWQDCDYVISLKALLAFIKESGIKRVELLGTSGNVLYSDPFWMSKFWRASSEEITQWYNAEGLDIIYGTNGNLAWPGLIITSMSK